MGTCAIKVGRGGMSDCKIQVSRGGWEGLVLHKGGEKVKVG